jgi:RNA polymerase sigma-70 factor (ECF subfamily)
MSLAERLLIARLRKRDEQAFNEVVRLHEDQVFNLVFRMVGNRAEAEDIAQEVFVTVFKSIDSFRGESKFTTWLLRIAANHSKNRIKYLSRRSTDKNGLDNASEANLADQGKAPVQGHIDAPDEALETAEIERVMQEAIATLDEEHRLLVVLRDIQDYSYEQICDITGLPEGTVKSRLHRARLALKEQIGDRLK